MSTSKIRWIRAALFLSAILFILWGLVRGEADEVMTKAVNICLECIGIG